MEFSAPYIPRQLARNLCDVARPRQGRSRDAQSRLPKVLFTHHALGGGDQAGLRISRAEGREALGIRLDPVEIDDSRVILVGQMAVEPQGEGSRRLLRQLDELLAADGGQVERLAVRAVRGEHGGGKERGSGDAGDHGALQSGRIGPDTPVKAPSTSSQTRSRAGSTGPGMRARPFGMRLKPDLP